MLLCTIFSERTENKKKDFLGTLVRLCRIRPFCPSSKNFLRRFHYLNGERILTIKFYSFYLLVAISFDGDKTS